jgi:Ca-activated chloride channel family protein
MRRALPVIVLAALLVPTTGAPQPQQQAPTLKVETNLVMLPVTVVDRRGEFVSGLSESQFTVYDNDAPQAIEFFTSNDVPATVGLVVDSSSSMRGRRNEITAAGVAFAQSSHPLDEMFSVNFNEIVWTGLPAGVPFAASVEQLQQALARAPAAGMTALYDAVDLALTHLQLGVHDRKALIVVSDGGDNASAQTLEAVLEHARRAGAVIYTVLVANPDTHDANPGVLRRLADETGGTWFRPKQVEDVMTAFRRVASEIRSGYMIGFAPTDGSGGFHAVRVVVQGTDGRPLVVRTRAGYDAGYTRGPTR